MIKKDTHNPRITITLTPAQYQQLQTLAMAEAEPVSTIAKRIIQRGLQGEQSLDKQAAIERLQAAILKQTIRMNTTLDHYLGDKSTEADRLEINQVSDKTFLKIVAATEDLH